MTPIRIEVKIDSDDNTEVYDYTVYVFGLKLYRKSVVNNNIANERKQCGFSVYDDLSQWVDDVDE